MVEHEIGDSRPAPLGVCENERDVCLIVLDVRNHKRKPYDEFSAKTCTGRKQKDHNNFKKGKLPNVNLV